MIRLLNIESFDEIHFMTLHPEIYPYVSNTEWDTDINTIFQYVLSSGIYKFIGIGNPLQGLVIYNPITEVMWQMHIQIYPAFRKQLDDDIKATQQFMYDNTPCRKIIGMLPVFNERMRKLAERLGHKKVGIIQDSYLYDGVMFDQILNEVVREV